MSAYPAVTRNHHLPIFAGYLLGDIHVRHSGAARAGIRGHPHGTAGRIRLRFVLHVQAHPFAEREGRQRAKPALRRAFRFGGQHPSREDLRDARTTSARCSIRRTARWWNATASACGRRLARGIITACITVVIMSVVAVFIAGGNAWYGISAGTLVMMFTYTYTVTNQFNFINNGLQRFNRAFGDASGMTQTLDEPRLVADLPGAPDMVVSKGTIDFEGIGFHYTDGNTKTTVFEDFNLHIPAGQRSGFGRPERSGQNHAHETVAALVRHPGRSHPHRRAEHRRMHAAKPSPLTSPTCRRRRCCSTAALPRTSPMGVPTPPWSEIREAAAQANALDFIENLPDRVRYHHRRARREALRRAAPARRHRACACWQTARCSCSTRPQAPLTPKARRSCKTLCQS